MDNDEKRFKIKQKDMYDNLNWEYSKDSAYTALIAAVMGMISIINFFIWGTSLISPLLFEEVLDKLKISFLSLPSPFFGWSGFLDGIISAASLNACKQSETNRSIYLERYLEYQDSLEYLEKLNKEQDSASYYEQDLERSLQKFAELQREISLDDDLENGLKR